MKFKISDLVKFRPNSPIYSILSNKSVFGLITRSARLMYVHDWEDKEVLKEFWAYDILIEGQIFKNVPEEGLEKLKNENEEYTK